MFRGPCRLPWGVHSSLAWSTCDASLLRHPPLTCRHPNGASSCGGRPPPARIDAHDRLPAASLFLVLTSWSQCGAATSRTLGRGAAWALGRANCRPSTDPPTAAWRRQRRAPGTNGLGGLSGGAPSLTPPGGIRTSHRRSGAPKTQLAEEPGVSDCSCGPAQRTAGVGKEGRPFGSPQPPAHSPALSAAVGRATSSPRLEYPSATQPCAAVGPPASTAWRSACLATLKRRPNTLRRAAAARLGASVLGGRG